MSGAMVGAPALEVDGLRVRVPRSSGAVVRAVTGVSFSVDAGETVAVVGESGSGKSVTALAVMGLIDPPGRDHRRRGPARRAAAASASARTSTARVRGRELAMVFQDPMTVAQPGAARRRPGRRGDRGARPARVSRRAARTAVVELLERVGIAPAAARATRLPAPALGRACASG